MTELGIWLCDTLVGHLSSPRTDRLRFEPSEGALSKWGAGSTMLSLALPLSDEARMPSDRLRAFFNGLLPEGAARDELTRRFNLRPRDIIGLLGELGEDCAGAVVALPSGQVPESRGGGYQELADRDLSELILNLASAPLGNAPDHVTRKSLAGVQPKLLLAKTPEGGWAQPTNGAPSTHILKPEERDYPGGASNEAWCMRLARACGLTTVDADVFAVDETPVFVVSRYDRAKSAGLTNRVHQEDSCQALAIETFDPRAKYGSHNTKRMTLRAIAELLRFHAPSERARLLAYTTFHIAIGNADAHGKNHSIMHHPDGAIELAPIYDAWSTIQYPRLSRTVSLSVDRSFKLDAIDRSRLVSEGASWGLPPTTALSVIEGTFESLRQALADRSLRDGLSIADAFVENLCKRVGELMR
jgi:serine/threonine-protein kinase HipA